MNEEIRGDLTMIRPISRMLMVVSMLSLFVGCDGSGSAPYVEGSKDEAAVKGTVKVKGKLVPGGTIHFNASNSKRMVPSRDAEVQPDGTFTLKAFVGQNIVTLTAPRKNRADAKNRDYFGLEYVDKYFEVKPGEENVADLDLTP
jgi:hypothetical protein